MYNRSRVQVNRQKCETILCTLSHSYRISNTRQFCALVRIRLVCEGDGSPCGAELSLLVL